MIQFHTPFGQKISPSRFCELRGKQTVHVYLYSTPLLIELFQKLLCSHKLAPSYMKSVPFFLAPDNCVLLIPNL